MFALVVSVALQASAAAPAPTAEPQTPVEVVAPTQPRRVCRIERNTGSRVQGRRICQTAEEREREGDENRQEAERSANRQWERGWGDQPFGQFAQPGGGMARGNGGPR